MPSLIKLAQLPYNEQLSHLDERDQMLQDQQQMVQNNIKGEQNRAFKQEVASGLAGAVGGGLLASFPKAKRAPLNSLLGASAGSAVGALGGRLSTTTNRNMIYDQEQKLDDLKDQRGVNRQERSNLVQAKTQAELQAQQAQNTTQPEQTPVSDPAPQPEQVAPSPLAEEAMKLQGA